MIFLKAKWQNLIMANYAVPEKILHPYLPKGLELDLYKGKAYISLVGFLFRDTRIFHLPVPIFGTFEEINLRFYVIKKTKKSDIRGVVFINETVPYRSVAWLANKLYNEHYTVVNTRRSFSQTLQHQRIMYEWKQPGSMHWHQLYVNAVRESRPMVPGSMEEFIFEHYAGYTEADNITMEYTVDHPRWETHHVIDFGIQCNFKEMYGEPFAFLNAQSPESVYLAKGSEVSIDWERKKIVPDERYQKD